jgi:hypothetical protein
MMMKRMVTALLITIVAATGCAPRYRPAQTPDRPAAPSPDESRSPDVWRQMAQRIAPGAGVKVLLVDGTRMRAVLLTADDTSIVVKRRTRVPEPERRIAYRELELLEADTGNGIGAGKAAAIGIGAGAGAFLTLLLITFAIYNDN